MTYGDVLIFLAGLVAGAMNAAGGGGSFVSLPALISIGVPSVTANMSSAIALYVGSITSAWGYRGEFQSLGDVSLSAMFLSTLAGGFAGAMVLLYTPASFFDAILPWLLVLGSLAFAFGPKIAGSVTNSRPHPSSLLIAQFLLGGYGGYFGGAVGVMMMAVWSLFGIHDVKVMNPVKVVLVAAANTVAVICFAVAGGVAWHAIAIMLPAAAVGGYLGARLTLMLNSSLLRSGITLLNFMVTVAFLFFRYAHK